MRQQFRFNWSSPIVLSPHNPRTIFFGGNHLFKSLDRGDKWMIISPDLTTNDPKKNMPTGGMTDDTTGAETHCTIISISESPMTPGLLWVGTDDGNVQITRNGGQTWTNVRPNIQGVPPAIWCSRVEASRFDEGTAYATFDGHRSDDFHVYVYKTVDYGKTWKAITAGIPDGQPVYVIREDLKNKNLLFLGTEFGAYVSRNAGQSWTSLSLNMPTVAVHDLLIHPRDNDLIAATHGRGFWIMDDISGLRQATDSLLSQDAAILEPGKPGTKWLRVQRGGYSRGDLFFKGENPPFGAILHVFLKAKPATPAILEITDATGQLKTTYLLDDAEPGLTRILWDFQFDPPEATIKTAADGAKRQVEAMLQRAELSAEQKAAVQEAMKKFDTAGSNYRKIQEIQTGILTLMNPGMAQFGGGRRMGGLQAEPGTYAVKLTVNGKTTIGKVVVRQDPIQAEAALEIR
jgi:hypothetical protein